MKFKNLITAIFFIFSSFIVYAQNDSAKIDTTIYSFTKVSKAPQFNGGIKAFYKYIEDNINYPKNNKTYGTVFISFVVETDGSISNIKIERGLTASNSSRSVKFPVFE